LTLLLFRAFQKKSNWNTVVQGRLGTPGLEGRTGGCTLVTGGFA